MLKPRLAGQANYGAVLLAILGITALAIEEADIFMQHDVVWTSWDAVDLEHLRLSEDPEAIWAEGTIVAIGEGVVFDATYPVLFDAFWRMRHVEVAVSPSLGSSLAMRTDGKGQ